MNECFPYSIPAIPSDGFASNLPSQVKRKDDLTHPMLLVGLPVHVRNWWWRIFLCAEAMLLITAIIHQPKIVREASNSSRRCNELCNENVQASSPT